MRIGYKPVNRAKQSHGPAENPEHINVGSDISVNPGENEHVNLTLDTSTVDPIVTPEPL